MLFRVFMLYDCREATPLKPRGFGAPRFLEKSQDKFLGMTSQQPLSCHPFCGQHDAWWSYCLTVLKCERTVFFGFSDTKREFCIAFPDLKGVFRFVLLFHTWNESYYYIWKDTYNGLLNMKGEFLLVFKYTYTYWSCRYESTIIFGIQIWEESLKGFSSMKGELLLFFKIWKDTFTGYSDLKGQFLLAFRI